MTKNDSSSGNATINFRHTDIKCRAKDLDKGLARRLAHVTKKLVGEVQNVPY